MAKTSSTPNENTPKATTPVTPPAPTPPDPTPPAPTPGVSRVGRWAVGTANGADFAVSRLCRHQLGDLSAGTIDANGCLVCPWHGARYNVTNGKMVSGPHGFLGYHGPTPGYTQFIQAIAQTVRLRIGKARRTITGWTVD